MLGNTEYIPGVHCGDFNCYACATQRHNCNDLNKLDAEGFETIVSQSNELEEDSSCDQCGKIPAKIEYKGGSYCTWYCAKKESK